MTTLNHEKLIAKLRKLSTIEFGGAAAQMAVEAMREAADALSSLPAQAVGVKPAAVAITDEQIDEIIEESVIGGTDDYPAINRAGLIADLVLALDALHHGNALSPPSQPAAVGEATTSDEELRKALRRRASLPETTPTDSYVMMKAERRIGAIASNSEPAMVRICPERDGRCPHGIDCPFAIDRGSCDMIASRAALRSTP